MAFAPKDAHGPRVVVLGGGNGTSRLLRALLPLLTAGKIASLHGLIHMADDGGSTGRLREQYEVGAMGDLTKGLMALSSLHGDIRGEKFLRALEYRFANGDFTGHTLRNVLLATLELTSDIDAAVATMARVLQVPKYAGIIPTTLKAVTQQVEVMEGGQRQVLGSGQHFISWQVDLQNQPHWKPGDVRVTFAEEGVGLNPRAQKALAGATHVIVAPGHTFGSILPTLACLQLDDKKTLARNKAQIIVVMTLLTTPRQTVGWSGEDFVRVYESYLGRPATMVIANTAYPDVELVEQQEWVKFSDGQHPYRLVAGELATIEGHVPQPGDTVPRAVTVHDSDTMREIFEEIL